MKLSLTIITITLTIILSTTVYALADIPETEFSAATVHPTASPTVKTVVASTATPEPPKEWTLADLIQNEAGVCGEEGMLAVAWVANRTSPSAWAGARKAERITEAAAYIAEHWMEYEDPTGGATFLFSLQDLKLSSVKKITAQHELVFSIDCVAGLGLRGYK